MSRIRFFCFTTLIVCCAATANARSKSAISSSNPEVISALEREAEHSADTDRRALLETARTDTAMPEVWWQSGYVRHGEAWQPFEQSKPANSDALREYVARREKARPTVGDQLKLANWCRDAGLRDQERVHLIQALSTGQVPNSAGLLQQLGYRRVGSHWYTEAEMRASQDELVRLGKEWKRLAPKLNALAAKLEGKPAMRAKGMSELRALMTRDALPILEFALAVRSEAAASALVETLSDVDSYRASQSLARLAIGSPWDSVRDTATETLKGRPWEEYVPMTLSLMYLPGQLAVIGSQRPRSTLEPNDGGFELRLIWRREGKTSVDVAIHRLVDLRNVVLTDPGMLANAGWRDYEHRLLNHVTDRVMTDIAYETAKNVEAVNESMVAWNHSTATFLQAITAQKLGEEPQVWWHWWDNAITDAPPTGEKETIIVSETELPIGVPLIRGLVGSCLAAGTLVRTETGFQPIEAIRIGDRVLSKHVETGELKFAPVLLTTRREKAALTKIQIGDETIAASAGHNFWISGRGWMRTNQLEDGMMAHTATGTATVRVEDAGRSADVFNLVVDDAHTYFVGKSLLLGHDVLIPPPTDIVVPGLSPEVAER